MSLRFLRFLRSRSGATAIEYGLLLGLISTVIILAGAAMGQNLSTLFQTIADQFGNTH